MKKKRIIYLLLILVFSSCYQLEKPDKPSKLLSEQDMINILTDMSILSATKGINKKKLEQNGILPKAYIYKKYDIDSSVFAQNNIYYSYDLDGYNRIYDKVKDTLTLLKKAAEKKKLKKLNKKSAKKKFLKNDLKLNSNQLTKKDSSIRSGLLKNKKLSRNRKERTLK